MKYKKEKRLLGIITAMYWFSLYTYVPILSPYGKSLGATGSMIGIILGSYGLTQTIVRIPLGILSDKLKKRKIFVTSGIVTAVISALGAYLFKNHLALLFFRGLSGIAAASWVIFTVLFTAYFEEDEVPKALGIISSYNYMGQVSAMLLGGWVAQAYGQENTFLLAAIVGFIGICLSFTIQESKPSQSKPLRLRDIVVVAQNKNLILASLLAIIFQILTFATVFGFTPMIAKDLGASSFELGLLSTISTLPMIFASSLSGTFFKDKIGIKATVILGFFLSALSCLAIPFSPNLWVLYISQMIGGFGRGIGFPLLMSLGIQDISSRKRATAMGFFQAIYGIGMFMGPALVGFISDHSGMTPAFVMISIFGFIGAGIASRI